MDKNDGRGFVKSGNSRADLNVTAYRNMDGFKYFCRIFDGEFSEDSNMAALSVLGLAKLRLNRSPQRAFTPGKTHL